MPVQVANRFKFRSAIPLVLTVWLCATSTLSAGDPVDEIFQSRFSEVIEPLFPQFAGEFVLPAYPVIDQLEWIISELDGSETTTLAEIQAHFSTGFDQPGLVNFFNNVLRPEFPNARIVGV